MERELLKNSRLLVIDDQASNVQLLERVLRLGGYEQVRSLMDPREVLELFALFQPDLILLDLMMPHIDGISLMKQLRSRIPEHTYLPVMIVTADITREARKNALSLGAKDFVTKPFDSTEILLRIHNLLETRSLHQRIEEQTNRRVREAEQKCEIFHLEVLERLAREAGFPEHYLRLVRRRAALVGSRKRLNVGRLKANPALLPSGSRRA